MQRLHRHASSNRQEWVDEIDRELRASQFFVVLLSAESIRSDMVRREIALSHKLRKAKQLRIFPVRVALTFDPQGRIVPPYPISTPPRSR